MDKRTIAKNFSRHAHTYDMYSDIQERMGHELLGIAGDKGAGKILEIGSGTGNYTLLLQKRFPGSEIKAIDISDAMIEIAAGKISGARVEFVLDDAETASLKEKFDIITSNACFQWFGNLENALAKYKKLLTSGGMILFSTFGPDTFKEMQESLKEALSGITINSGNFIERVALEGMLKKEFAEIEIKEGIYAESFSSLTEFLGKIKHSGIRGNSRAAKFFFTPQLMEKLEKIYVDKFGQIRATYQAFFCRGIN